MIVQPYPHLPMRPDPMSYPGERVFIPRDGEPLIEILRRKSHRRLWEAMPAEVKAARERRGEPDGV